MEYPASNAYAHSLIKVPISLSLPTHSTYHAPRPADFNKLFSNGFITYPTQLPTGLNTANNVTCGSLNSTQKKYRNPLRLQITYWFSPAANVLNPFQRFIDEFHKTHSPYEVLRIFNDVFNNANTFHLEHKYGITKYDVRMIRQFPNECVLYTLDIQQQLGVYYKNNAPAELKKAV
jgi:hypothetical protein